jgi:hypothetical protein
LHWQVALSEVSPRQRQVPESFQPIHPHPLEINSLLLRLIMEKSYQNLLCFPHYQTIKFPLYLRRDLDFNFIAKFKEY